MQSSPISPRPLQHSPTTLLPFICMETYGALGLILSPPQLPHPGISNDTSLTRSLSIIDCFSCSNSASTSSEAKASEIVSRCWLSSTTSTSLSPSTTVGRTALSKVRSSTGLSSPTANSTGKIILIE